MEAFLHYVWEHRLWDELIPEGILAGCDVEVFSTGLCNIHAGPDFLEAKVRIDNITWVGAVEIHSRASEWYEHGHHEDPAYRGTILHVVEDWDREVVTTSGRPVPALVMRVPQVLRAEAEALVNHAHQLACSPLGDRLDRLFISSYLQDLALERLRAKALRIRELAERYDWHEALYITLLRYYGFGLNNDTMELLAQALPYKLLARYLDQPLDSTALLLGQASLLDPALDGEEEEYIQRYQHLRRKHQLSPIDPSLWKRLRTRPASFPRRRILQLAELLSRQELGLSAIIEAEDMLVLRQLLRGLSKTSQDSILINVLLPLRYAYATTQGPDDPQPSLQMLAELSPERNKITRLFDASGICPSSALESQALVQLYKEYCLAHKCIYCRWGRKILSKPLSIDNLH